MFYNNALERTWLCNYDFPTHTNFDGSQENLQAPQTLQDSPPTGTGLKNPDINQSQLDIYKKKDNPFNFLFE